MVIATVLSLGLVRGQPWVQLILLGLAEWAPLLGLAAVGVLWLRERPASTADAEVAFLASVTSHLDSGQSLRHAIDLAADAVTIDLRAAQRAIRAGVPMDRVAALLAPRLPTQGASLAAAVTLAASSGGSASAVLESLTADASRELDLRREMRAGTAGARFSALLLGGGPVAAVLFRSSAVTDGGPVSLLVVAGTTLSLAGAAVTWAMVRRATR